MAVPVSIKVLVVTRAYQPAAVQVVREAQDTPTSSRRRGLLTGAGQVSGRAVGGMGAGSAVAPIR